MGRYSGSCKQIGPEIVNNIETLIVNKPRITSKKVPKTDYSSPDSQNLGSSMVLLIGVVNWKSLKIWPIFPSFSIFYNLIFPLIDEKDVNWSPLTD